MYLGQQYQQKTRCKKINCKSFFVIFSSKKQKWQ